MYAKILTLLVLAILCTGCTDPDLPDPYEFENVTPGAPALKKGWDPTTLTITIRTLDDTPRLTIQKISSKPDLCTFEEVLEIKSFVDYDLNKLKDFRARWHKHKGQHDVTKVEWFILKNESYDITVNDYETIQVEETLYNNVTEEYYYVTVNQTVLVGNHSDVRYHDIWKSFSPVGKSIYAGQTYTIKIIYHKPPELGNVRIQTIPMFAGIECEELTWWNSSWDNKREIMIDNTGGSALSYYQVNVNLTAAPINSTSLRVVNETADATAPHWQETISSGNCTDLWFNVTSIPASLWLNGTYYIYYGNNTASSVSSGATTFLQWHGAATSNFLDALVVSPTNVVYEGKIKRIGSSNILWGLADTSVMETNRLYVQSHTGNNARSVGASNSGSHSYISESPQFADGVWVNAKLTCDGSVVYGYIDGNEIGSGGVTTNIPTATLGLGFREAAGSAEQLWSFARKCTATEPSATLGEEESVIIITAYTPSTPLSKTAGDSQLFTVNTSENSQCRWYINGSLVQTNSTGAIRHEYLNSSLDEGYWNFTATANTTNQTSSQTWWVTVSAAGTFEQDMYIDHWMYVTYLNGSNTNLSEFSTDLTPYYLSFYNATDQKTYNYKSGRWEKYADKIIKPGEAAMLRYTSGITKTRNNAPGTFGLTLKTGLNHIGHSYNGTHNLTWYNTTIASANLVTITHQNPETGALSTFTYGSADNGSVDVLQGCGVEVNVSADTVISGL